MSDDERTLGQRYSDFHNDLARQLTFLNYAVHFEGEGNGKRLVAKREGDTIYFTGRKAWGLDYEDEFVYDVTVSCPSEEARNDLVIAIHSAEQADAAYEDLAQVAEFSVLHPRKSDQLRTARANKQLKRERQERSRRRRWSVARGYDDGKGLTPSSAYSVASVSGAAIVATFMLNAAVASLYTAHNAAQTHKAVVEMSVEYEVQDPERIFYNQQEALEIIQVGEVNDIMLEGLSEEEQVEMIKVLRSLATNIPPYGDMFYSR